MSKEFKLISNEINETYNKNIYNHELCIGEFFSNNEDDLLKMSFVLSEYRKNNLVDVTNFNATVDFFSNEVFVEAYNSTGYSEYTLIDYEKEVEDLLYRALL